MNILQRQKSGTRQPDEKTRRAAYGQLKRIRVAMERYAPDENGYWIDCITETIDFEEIEEFLVYFANYKGHIKSISIYAL